MRRAETLGRLASRGRARGYSFPRTSSTLTAAPPPLTSLLVAGSAIPMAEQPFTAVRLRPSRRPATSARLTGGDDDNGLS